MSTGNRRDSLSILADLLDHMEEPRRITHLLYASNLNYGQLSKYLKMLMKMGLADEQMKPYHLFKITSEGKFFMDIINRRMNRKQQFEN